MYSNKQVNQLWRQVNYLNKTCGIPIATLSKKTKINYQHLLNFYNGKLTLGQSGIDNLEKALKLYYSNYLGI